MMAQRSFACRIVASAKRMKSKSVAPRNSKQSMYIDMLTSEDTPNIVLATGSAGTGKTFLATHVGVRKLINAEVQKLVITRPAVSVDEQHGFLPGTLEKKMEPWIRPVLDILMLYYPRTKIDTMFKEQSIEICPLAFMRGRTFDNSFIICDESQNTTVNQMLMVLTRIGKNSKLVITGDPAQYDRGFADNGLVDLLGKLRRNELHDAHEYIEYVEFQEEDVERHPAIPHVLDLYRH